MSNANLLEEIARLHPELRKSERKVAEVILDDPPRATHMKLAELARLAGVSEPTVIRFCNAIGCEGFQDMKIKLARSLAFGLSSSHAAISDSDSLDEVVTKIFDFNLTSLDWVRSKLDKAAIGAAVDLILGAKSLHFIGFGASAIVARDAQQKLPLFGIPTYSEADVHQMLMATSLMTQGDILVAISNSGMTREILQLVRVARDRGAKVIGITGSQSPLARFSDIALIVESLDNTDQYTPTISRIAALVVVDILSTMVALKRSPEERHQIAEMKKYLADVRAHGII
ncbi:MAG: MurR/RpiR family transcriptional regulator [Tropicimonas sp.]|uniref:MurR/RpiR family transcriptional regulator n=1 Tax=Tropicimonas sp. TaxID=2067044 RepID=UPI003A8643E7